MKNLIVCGILILGLLGCSNGKNDYASSRDEILRAQNEKIEKLHNDKELWKSRAKAEEIKVRWLEEKLGIFKKTEEKWNKAFADLSVNFPNDTIIFHPGERVIEVGNAVLFDFICRCVLEAV